MSSSNPSADEIQREMQQVRVELREDMQVMVQSARELTDWTYYVRTYPWACMGAAAAIGFLIVPPRTPVIRPDPKDLLELVKDQKVTVKMEEKRAAPSFAGSLLRMAAGSLLQGGLAILTHQFDQYRQEQARRAASNGNTRGTVHD
ncbi:MAG TPA: hypothetical protein VFV87_13195 [Pirellulaceae bacterium]|nr:hypothetical protein [Pirellulaceae bacterium]